MRLSDFYHSGHRQLQEEFQSIALADRLRDIIVRPTLDENAKAFIKAQNHFYLTTVDLNGFPTVSHKGGHAGFVHVLDDRTLLFPCYDGNGMWLSAGNISDTNKIGMLFINLVEPHRIRVQGTARLVRDTALLERWENVGLAVEISITNTWINCPRYIHKMAPVSESLHVPAVGRDTEEAEWKSLDAVADVLPPQPHEVDNTPS